MKTILIALTIFISTNNPVLTRPEADLIIRRGVRQIYKELGVKLQIRKVYGDDPCISLNTLNTRLQRLYCYIQNPPLRNTHYLVNPILDNNQLYLAGYTSKTCSPFNGTSYSLAESFNNDNQPRIRHSIVALMHELGHKFGANHDDSGGNVMHSNALAYAGSSLHFNKKAKAEVRQCLN